MTEKLALFGGQPARKEPFKSSGDFDHNEILSVMEVFKNGEFSRYAGGGCSNLKEILNLKSRETEKYKLPYWNFLGGKKVRQFENDFSEYFDIDYSIAVNSATSALSVALAACGVGPGDEVITTPMSFTATASSILLFNSIPVFVDIDPVNYCIDHRKLEAAITKSTKLLVHLFGNAAEMDEIIKIARKHNLYVIEDCAQSPGVKYKGRYVGTIGDAGVFSFQETKNMMTGEGSMIVTNNSKIAANCRLIRNHGEFALENDASDNELLNIVGCNFRMTELTAALGTAQLKKLDKKNKWRNNNAGFLKKELSKIPFIKIIEQPDYVDKVYHFFVMEYSEKKTGISRKIILDALIKEGLPVTGGYVRLMYQNPLFLRKIAYGEKGCPFTCKFYENKIEYYNGLCPYSEKLIHEIFIFFYHVNYPNDLDDMKDVVNAFNKVNDNLEELRKVDESKIKIEYGR